MVEMVEIVQLFKGVQLFSWQKVGAEVEVIIVVIVLLPLLGVTGVLVVDQAFAGILVLHRQVVVHWRQTTWLLSLDILLEKMEILEQSQAMAEVAVGQGQLLPVLCLGMG